MKNIIIKVNIFVVTILLVTGCSRLYINSLKAKADDDAYYAVNYQFKLGMAYCFGENNTKINKIEGMKWFEKAANSGHEESKKQLIKCRGQ